MYAGSEAALASAMEAVEALEEDCKNFVHSLHANLERQHEWVAFHRLKLITRNHDTNNYAEASIRILKDIVLRLVGRRHGLGLPCGSRVE